MTTQEIISAIGLIGLGGLLKGVLDFFIADRKRKSETKHQFKEIRYKSIILLCYAYINFNKEVTTLVVHRPDINSRERLFNELLDKGLKVWKEIMSGSSLKKSPLPPFRKGELPNLNFRH